MKNFWDYLEEATPYLEYCSAGKTPDDEKIFITRVVNLFGLDKEFNAKANEDFLWRKLAEEGVFYYVDVVRPGLYASEVKPELKMLRLEFGTKAVIKLLVDTNTLRACK